MDEHEVTGSKVLPFARPATTLAKRLPQLLGFPKLARELRRAIPAPEAPAPVARLLQDTKRLPD